MEKLILVFDSSEQDDFSLCKRRWHLIHHLNLHSIVGAYALDRGTLLHTVLAEYYRLKMAGVEELQAVEMAIAKGRESSVEIEGLDPQDCAAVYFQVREYCRYWSEREEPFYPIEIEKPFFKIIYEDDVPQTLDGVNYSGLVICLQGVIDYLGKYVGTDNLVILDHKGVSQRTEYSSLRNQFKNYCIAKNINTLVVNKIGFQKTLPPSDRFIRQTINYTQDQLDEQMECLIADGKMMLVHLQSEYYPPTFTSCELYSGCTFMENFCKARPDVRPFRIGTYFVIGKKWDVGKVLEKGEEVK